jgi:hypothetical protein
VVDEVAIPDRLEEPIGETERENVLRGLLAEKVIDSEDLFLVEHLVQACVQRHRARKVGAERLLHDDRDRSTRFASPSIRTPTGLHPAARSDSAAGDSHR